MTRAGPSEILQSARALAVDAVCAEVADAWGRAGVEAILLKGPALARWLYPDEVRSYVDADMLVSPADVMRAAEVLEQLGFKPVAHYVSLHAHPWVRARDEAELDLHVTLWGPHQAADRVWNQLRQWTEVMDLASVPIRTLNAPGRALHVALHAAQHLDQTKPREDLKRAVRVVPVQVWRDAEVLADRIGALPAMVEGLQSELEGERLLRELPLARATLTVAQADAPLAIGLARWTNAVGLRAKMEVLIAAYTRPFEDYGLPPADEFASPVKRRIMRLEHLRSLVRRTPRTIVALQGARRRARN